MATRPMPPADRQEETFVSPRGVIPTSDQLLPVNSSGREHSSLSLCLQGSDIASSGLEVGSKQDCGPDSAGEREMPTLVPQTSLSKDEGFQDVGASAMPVLSNIVDINSQADHGWSDSGQQPRPGSGFGPATQADTLDPNSKNSLTIVVEHEDGKSPEIFPEPSPSNSDCMIIDEPMESSPNDDDVPPCSSNSVPPCKGQVLNGEHSPDFSLRESCDMSSFEGESSQPMTSPQGPRSVSSTVQVGDSQDGLDSPPPLSSVGMEPELSVVDHLARDLSNVDVSADEKLSVSSPSDLEDASSGQYDSLSEHIDIPSLTPCNSQSVECEAQWDIDTSENLPDLTLENSQPVSFSSKRKRDSSPVKRFGSPLKSNGSPQKRPIFHRKTKGPHGDRKSYMEFYDQGEEGCSSDSSDASYTPVQSRRKKKRRTRNGRGTRAYYGPFSSKHPSVHPSSGSPPDQCPGDFYSEQESQFVDLETKICALLEICRKCRLQPCSSKLYKVLRSLGSPEAGLSQRIRGLSLQEDQLCMHPAVEMEKLGVNPEKRFHLLVSATAALVKEMGFDGGDLINNLFRTWHHPIPAVQANLGRVLDTVYESVQDW